MPVKTPAQQRAQQTYMAKFARLELRTTPDERDAIQAHAQAQGESVNGFIKRAIHETMERDREGGADGCRIRRS